MKLEVGRKYKLISLDSKDLLNMIFDVNFQLNTVFECVGYYENDYVCLRPIGYRGTGSWKHRHLDTISMWAPAGVLYKNKRRSHVDSQNKT